MAGPWWKTAIIYQIYPCSFQDSNRDGVGDLPGVIGGLPYLMSEGVPIKCRRYLGRGSAAGLPLSKIFSTM
jgi:hypothetical protein